jgi:hypothetical protein
VNKPRLSQIYLQECFDYLPVEGILRWRKRPLQHFENEHRRNNWNSRWVGKEAGAVHKASGYRVVSIGGWMYKVHMLIWVHYYGFWPEADVDHWDLVRTNNRISNFREASRSNNLANRRKQANNKSGHKGVCWSKAARKWLAQIKIRGVYQYLGTYEDLEEAASVYEKAARNAFGGFARVV